LIERRPKLRLAVLILADHNNVAQFRARSKMRPFGSL
jgi:hypothetical protein